MDRDAEPERATDVDQERRRRGAARDQIDPVGAEAGQRAEGGSRGSPRAEHQGATRCHAGTENLGDRVGDAHDIGVEPVQARRCPAGRARPDDDGVDGAEKRRGVVQCVEQCQDGRLERHGERQARPARINPYPAEQLRQGALVTLDGRVVPVESQRRIGGCMQNR